MDGGGIYLYCKTVSVSNNTSKILRPLTPDEVPGQDFEPLDDLRLDPFIDQLVVVKADVISLMTREARQGGFIQGGRSFFLEEPSFRPPRRLCVRLAWTTLTFFRSLRRTSLEAAMI